MQRRLQRCFPRLAAALAATALLASSASVSAQTEDEARAQREATRAEQARVAAQLDVARAEESDIRAALFGLDQAVAFQESKVDAAAQGLSAAQDTATAARQRVAETAAQIAEVRARAQATVLDSYIGGVGTSGDQVFASRDVAEASQRRQLLDVIRGRFTDDLDLLRALRQDNERAQRTADTAVTEAAKQQAALNAALAELTRQRDTQARLEDALKARIGNYQAEADRLKAAEDELTGVINRHLAEQAAAEAAARGAATAEVPLPKLTAASASGFILPADAEITSPFGYRRHPILGTVRLHSGTDFGAPYGAPIVASKSGEVIFAGWNGGYGNCVIIAHDGGISTLYGHQSEIAVSEGQQVGRGEIVGYIGSTGQSTGPHLHFEVRIGGEPVDPMLFL